MESIVLRIVIFKQEDMYVAQCLEHDIMVQGPDMDTVKERFEATLELEGDDLDSIPAAPEAFQKMWDAGLTLESKVDNAEMRLAA